MLFLQVARRHSPLLMTAIGLATSGGRDKSKLIAERQSRAADAKGRLTGFHRSRVGPL